MMVVLRPLCRQNFGIGDFDVGGLFCETDETSVPEFQCAQCAFLYIEVKLL
jgi:hypothetical protein